MERVTITVAGQSGSGTMTVARLINAALRHHSVTVNTDRVEQPVDEMPISQLEGNVEIDLVVKRLPREGETA